jgi:anti-sigma factor RsiW
MNCSPHDLHDYLFEELSPAQTTDVRAHLKTCAPCATELDRLRATQTVLLALRDEEIPQRIGFVSDKVFEPSPVRRWLAGFWTSAARIGFVSAAMLSGAILVHTVHSAQEVHSSAQTTYTQAELDRRIQDAVATQVTAQVEARVDAQIRTKLDAAVTQAVAETEERAQKRTNTLLAAAEKRLDLEKWAATVQSETSRHDDMVRKAAMVRANFESTAQ